MANRLFNSLPEDIFGYPKMGATSLDYDEYWAQRGPGKVRDRFRVMADWIEPGDEVLDIGCGDGLCLRHLSENTSIEARGVDISIEAARLASEALPEARIQSGDVIAEPELIGRPDVIILSEVLEHLPNPEDMILATRGRYQKRLLITIPNFGFYRYRLRSLFGRFPVQWVHHPSEHLRFWSIRDFTWWLGELGFSVEAVVPTNGLSMLGLYRSKPLMNLTAWQVLFVVRPVSGVDANP